MVGVSRNRFSDWLLVQERRTGRRHVDQAALRDLPRRAVQRRGRPAGIQAKPCTEPLDSRSASRVCASHTPSFFSSSTR